MMSDQGDVDHQHKPKRQRSNRVPRFSRKSKGKDIVEEKAVLSVNIICATDIDLELRSVTNNRYYGVIGWINPEVEYHTTAYRPNVCNSILDPVWKELFVMPLDETSLEEATLHLDVLRISDKILDPSSSQITKLVGRVQFKLDQLEANKPVNMWLQLMQPGQFGWKPEGQIYLEMELQTQMFCIGVLPDSE